MAVGKIARGAEVVVGAEVAAVESSSDLRSGLRFDGASGEDI